MQKSIQISVVIPSYKTEYEVMKRTVDSVLSQTYKPLEIIIIDDNGLNEFSEYNKRIECEYSDSVIVLYNKTNSGANFSRNIGIQAARGSYIAFLDSDDEWSPKYIEKIADKIIETNAKFIAVNLQIISKEGVMPSRFTINERKSGNIAMKELVADCAGPTSALVIEKDTLILAGMFDCQLPARQDYDMSIRVSQLVDIHYIYEPLVRIYRDGHDSISSSYKRNVSGTKMVLDKILKTYKLTESERKEIIASHNFHMAMACILCNAYSDAKPFLRVSINNRLTCKKVMLYVLCCMPSLFSFAKRFRRTYIYKK